MIPSYDQMGFPIVGETYGLEINEIDVARVAIDLEASGLDIRQFQYIYAGEGNFWILGLAAERENWEQTRTDLIEIAESFELSGE